MVQKTKIIFAAFKYRYEEVDYFDNSSDGASLIMGAKFAQPHY